MTNRKERRVNLDLLAKKSKNHILAFVLKCLFWMFYYIDTLNEHSKVNQNVRKSSATSTQVNFFLKINKKVSTDLVI